MVVETETAMDQCTEQQLESFVKRSIVPAFVTLAMHPTGSMSLQFLVLNVLRVKFPNLLQVCLVQIKRHCLLFVTHPVASSLIRKVMTGTFSESRFIVEIMAANVRMIATDDRGRRVLQDLMFARDSSQLCGLYRALLPHALALSRHIHGNYVIQTAIEMASEWDSERLQEELLGHFVRLSLDRCGSNVVETCLRHRCKRFSQHIVTELLSPRTLGALLHHRYGNYVMQTALSSTVDGGEMKLMMQAISAQLPSLPNHIRSKWKRFAVKALQRCQSTT